MRDVFVAIFVCFGLFSEICIMILMIIIGAVFYFATISKYFILVNYKIITLLKAIVIATLKPFKRIYHLTTQLLKKK